MNPPKDLPRTIALLRWFARFWAVLDLLLAIAIYGYFYRAPLTSLPFTELLLGGLYWVAVLGLVLAWGWELPGALAAIAGLALHVIAYRAIRGAWSLEMPIAVAILGPAFLFLFCRAWERGWLNRKLDPA